MRAELVVWLSVWTLGLCRDGYVIGALCLEQSAGSTWCIEPCARDGSKGLLSGSLQTWSRATLDGS